MLRRLLLAATMVAAAAPAVAGAAPKAGPSVVGGHDAAIEDWPSIAYVLSAWDEDGNGTLDYPVSCAGTVIAPDWILTAAHCAFRPDGRLVDGMLSITGEADADGGEQIAADRIVVHPRWDLDQLTGDALLMHLDTPSTRPPMPLARTGGSYTTDPAVPNVAGWGRTDEASTLDAAVLQEAYLAVDDACTGVTGVDATTQTCARGETAGVCHGDSGGPLTQLDAAGVAHLWGVTSYTEPEDRLPCDVRSPAVFSRVSALTGWVDAQLTPAAAQISGSAVTSPLPAVPRDTTPPVLRAARLSVRRFAAARNGATLARRAGARLSFVLSEAAAVRVAVLKRGKALSPTATIAGRAGRTRRTFTGRLGSRRLRPGRYRLRLAAVDVAGNVATPVRLRFRIVR